MGLFQGVEVEVAFQITKEIIYYSVISAEKIHYPFQQQQKTRFLLYDRPNNNFRWISG